MSFRCVEVYYKHLNGIYNHAKKKKRGKKEALKRVKVNNRD